MISEPMEWLELADGQSVRLRARSFEWSDSVIHPRYPGAPAEKPIPVVRIHLLPGVKPTGMPYYDVSSKTLQGQLRPLSEQLSEGKREFVITAHGSGPGKRFSVRLE